MHLQAFAILERMRRKVCSYVGTFCSASAGWLPYISLVVVGLFWFGYSGATETKANVILGSTSLRCLRQ